MLWGRDIGAVSWLADREVGVFQYVPEFVGSGIEVAPLMMVGVVKLAPTLPLDANFPFLHLDRKFMHLGFHIYDVGFQSPNVEAARPLVYATALLLVVIIVTLNLTAIAIRNRLREKYNATET